MAQYIIIDEKHGCIVNRYDEPTQDMHDLAVKYHRTHRVPVSMWEHAGDVTDEDLKKHLQAEADETLRKQAEQQKVIDDHMRLEEARRRRIQAELEVDAMLHSPAAPKDVTPKQRAQLVEELIRQR